jgi:RNA polymerase sigma-70 factor (ECF subfamily)
MRGVLTYQTASAISSGRTVQAPTDDQLVERIRADESQAFVQLYQRYKHRVYAYCYRLLRHPQNAEDATQETFVKIHRSLRQLENSALLHTWVFSIARNEAFTILRRAKPMEGLEKAMDDVWEEDGPLERVVERERAEIVRHCLGLLKPAYRELLILREYEQLSYSEIAAITGATESAIKSALFKARKSMAKRLEILMRERNEP